MAGRSLSIEATEALFVPADGARALWAGGADQPSILLFGLSFDNKTLTDATSDLLTAARTKRKTSVVFVNAHVINTAASDAAYRQVIARADVRLCDGSGMAIAAKLVGTPFAGNPNGTDLFPLLAARAAESGLKIFLLGGAEGVAAAAAETVRAAGYASAIAGTHHGYFQPDSEQERAAIEAINASSADIVLVGLGVPLQDVWIDRNRDRLTAPVLAGVGGLFDFFAGRVSRAPIAVRSVGMEWAWRLAQEPGRLWHRYLVGNVTFLARAVANALAARSNAIGVVRA